MFTTKKLTLIESSTQLLEKSKVKKSIFIKLKDDLIFSNKELMAKASELSTEAQALLDQQQLLSEESLINNDVINNIDQILGKKIKKDENKG